MTVDTLREQLSEFLGFSIPETPVPFVTHNTIEEHGYSRIRISYTSQEGELIPAFLLLPKGEGPFAAVLIHHQHNSQRHLGKSEEGISLLRAHPLIDVERVGILGHSYGGNTVLFHGALDERIRFACASGAACSYQHKMACRIGIEMAEVIPGFATRYDVPDLVTCFAPRRVLLVSATDDKASQDADRIVTIAQETCATMGIAEHIEHKRYEGGHAITQERFDAIVHWLVGCIG